MDESIRQYMREIGRKGGSRTGPSKKRKLTKREARRIALVRWAKAKAAEVPGPQ